MNKLYLKALERIWIAEVEGRLPLQSKAAVFDELQLDGLAEFGSDQWGTSTVSGWYLTQAGRLAYCSSCPQTEGDQQ